MAGISNLSTIYRTWGMGWGGATTTESGVLRRYFKMLPIQLIVILEGEEDEISILLLLIFGQFLYVRTFY